MSCENNLRDDILQPLAVNEWLLLKNALRRDWPHFAYYHYWLDNAMKWKEKNPHMRLDVLCPGGRHDAGVFIGVSSYSIYMLVPFAFDESKSLLFDCIVKTNRIDWSEAVIFAAVHEYFVDVVKDAIAFKEKTTGLQLDDVGPSNFYFKPKEECLDVEIKAPDGFELKALRDTDVATIHDLWPREEVKKEPKKSMAFISAMVKLNRGIGLFDVNNGTLVSWALQSEFTGLSNVQTANEYQRRGFAKIVVNALAKLLAEEGLDCSAFIVSGNWQSEKLFGSLDYKRVNAETFIVMKPLKT